MHSIELDDWGRFGKIRQAEEKRLRDPDDVFIHAEERRQELRKNASNENLRTRSAANPPEKGGFLFSCHNFRLADDHKPNRLHK